MFRRCLFAEECPAPDLFLRTSGENRYVKNLTGRAGVSLTLARLSDFMLWQLSRACLSFFPIMWPELTIWWFIRVLLEFQISKLAIESQNEATQLQCTNNPERQTRIDDFVRQVRQQRQFQILKLSQKQDPS